MVYECVEICFVDVVDIVGVVEGEVVAKDDS